MMMNSAAADVPPQPGVLGSTRDALAVLQAVLCRAVDSGMADEAVRSTADAPVCEAVGVGVDEASSCLDVGARPAPGGDVRSDDLRVADAVLASVEGSG